MHKKDERPLDCRKTLDGITEKYLLMKNHLWRKKDHKSFNRRPQLCFLVFSAWNMWRLVYIKKCCFLKTKFYDVRRLRIFLAVNKYFFFNKNNLTWIHLKLYVFSSNYIYFCKQLETLFHNFLIKHFWALKILVY